MKYVLVTFSAPNRAQVSSRTLQLTIPASAFQPFWSKVKLQGLIFGPLENRKTIQKLSFEDRLALGPSQNGLWKGLGKNMKILRKNDARMRGVGWLGVWRYTLRLFHTFTIFDKKK